MKITGHTILSAAAIIIGFSAGYLWAVAGHRGAGSAGAAIVTLEPRPAAQAAGNPPGLTAATVSACIAQLCGEDALSPQRDILGRLWGGIDPEAAWALGEKLPPGEREAFLRGVLSGWATKDFKAAWSHFLTTCDQGAWSEPDVKKVAQEMIEAKAYPTSFNAMSDQTSRPQQTAILDLMQDVRKKGVSATVDSMLARPDGAELLPLFASWVTSVSPKPVEIVELADVLAKSPVDQDQRNKLLLMMSGQITSGSAALPLAAWIENQHDADLRDQSFSLMAGSLTTKDKVSAWNYANRIQDPDRRNEAFIQVIFSPQSSVTAAEAEAAVGRMTFPDPAATAQMEHLIKRYFAKK